MPFDRDIFFERVRDNPFGGSLSQEQVDGLSALLKVWEEEYEADNPDLRWLAYSLATTLHESASSMMPVREHGLGEGMEYGEVDPETGQVYYGRGYIQTTWRENYARADKELGLTGDRSCEWHADNQLDPEIAASSLYEGLIEGWYRSSGGTPNNLAKYFNDETDDAYMARETTNGDKSKVPSWSNGVSIGNLIKGYHQDFLDALELSFEPIGIELPPPAPAEIVVQVRIEAPKGVRVIVTLPDPSA